MNDLSAKSEDSQGSPSTSAFRTVFPIGLLGAFLLWLSFAPVQWWPLAWFAITPWCWLVETKRLEGRRPYFWIWLAGFMYWLATLYFLPIPHWLLWGGWLVFSLYLSLFLPLFVGLSRVLSHKFRVPTVIAVPVIWTGIEFLRSNYIVEFSCILLGHTQFKFPVLIQTADLFGAYTVSFLIAMFAACITKIWAERKLNAQTIGAIGLAALVMGGTVGYGYWKLSVDRTVADSPVVKVALIQGSIDTIFPTAEEAAEYTRREAEQYRKWTWEARKAKPDLDLIVWPESSFVSRHLIQDPNENEETEEQLESWRNYRDSFRYLWAVSQGLIGTPEAVPPERWEPVEMIVGCGASNPVTGENFNTAAFLDKQGEVSAMYHKEELILFGEYVPLARKFPALQSMTPIGAGLDRGNGPKIFEVGGLKVAPNICFESTLPHLIRRHVNEPAEQGNEPDILLNITNDGWFYGTSCLDHHLACNVFRAVENRKPMLVCANTGFSAIVDSAGQLNDVGPRRKLGILYHDAVKEKSQFSPYRVIGDWIPWSFAMVTVVTFFVGWYDRRKGCDS